MADGVVAASAASRASSSGVAGAPAPRRRSASSASGCAGKSRAMARNCGRAASRSLLGGRLGDAEARQRGVPGARRRRLGQARRSWRRPWRGRPPSTGSRRSGTAPSAPGVLCARQPSRSSRAPRGSCRRRTRSRRARTAPSPCCAGPCRPRRAAPASRRDSRRRGRPRSRAPARRRRALDGGRLLWGRPVAPRAARGRGRSPANLTPGAATATIRRVRRPPVFWKANVIEGDAMGSVNKVILVGNLGADPELKYTPSSRRSATSASRRPTCSRTRRASARRGRNGTA